MKKLFLLALACSFFAVGTTNAQTETYYGGQKGSWAITVGADPVINFVGNMFNGTQDNSLGNLGATLAGKYFLSDKLAVTAGVTFDNWRDKQFTINPEDKDHKEVINTNTTGNRYFAINAGAQYYFRPGKRLQPFVSANISYGRTNNYTINKDYEYTVEGEIQQYDTTTKTSSPANIFGCAANIGVEYFLGKNFSISGELGIGLETSTYKSVSKFDTETPEYPKEQIDAQNYKEKNERITSFGTLMNGNIAFNFYF